jgi:hypothetical protein
MTQADLDNRLEAASTVSASLVAKLRYLLELRCRELEVTCSRYIAAALDASLKDETGDTYLNDWLWHDDPAIRLYRLATSRADLLSHHERLLWRSIPKDQRVCDAHGRLDPDEISKQWQRLIVGF